MHKADPVQRYILNILKITVMKAGDYSELLDERGHINIRSQDDPQGFEVFAGILCELENQKILPLTVDFWRKSAYRFELLEKEETECFMDFYRILSCAAAVTRLFEAQGIPGVVLKGISIAKLYPVPEYRKSSDADILLSKKEDVTAACELLEKNGFVRAGEAHSLHHIEFMSPTKVLVELHTDIAEPFDNENTNRCLERLVSEGCAKRIPFAYAGDETYIFEEPDLGLSIAVHALQHFMRKGMGIKMLLDWAAFIQYSGLDKTGAQKLKKSLNTLGIKGFTDAMTRLSCTYLGADISKASLICDDCKSSLAEWEEAFLADMFSGGEFGKASDERMVNLRGTGIGDYIREFHHQMRLNFPRLGKVFVIWPVLWVVTLLRFLKNNRKLRGTKTGDILKSAGERGRIVSGMKLFGG